MTKDELVATLQAAEEAKCEFEYKADAIAREVSHFRHSSDGYVKSITSREIEFEYNTSCNCHPEDATDSFPLEYLFIDWKVPETAAVQAREAGIANEKRERERLAAIEADKREKETFERLKAKFEG